MKIQLAFGLVTLLLSQPALACSIDPFIIQLPGETEAEAHARSDAHLSDQSAYRSYSRESNDFERAKAVYLARVVAKTEPGYSGKEKIWPSTRVRPFAALKGALPKSDQALTDETWGGMCDTRGDGDGAWGNIGELVVVFVGLPKSEQQPRGIDSFRARLIRTSQVLDQFRAIGKDIEE